ncbi:hypothetical protein JCM3770_003090 [Rhodotorula araucariae]
MAPLLPVDKLALQLETLELAQSLFPLDGELALDEASQAALPSLRQWANAGKDGDTSTVAADELQFAVRLSLEQPDDPSSPYPLVLDVHLPLTPSVDVAHTLPDGTSAAVIHLQQPPWLSRTAHDALAASLPSSNPSAYCSNADLLLETIDYIRNETFSLLPPPIAVDPVSQAGGGRRRRTAPRKEDEPEFRVWLWFPSLSTREKREDIVNWAPDYDITGFVLAGKPAIMCLEGTESNVQAYLADIKANSWADIPSFQKKVSERYRTPLLPPPPPPSQQPQSPCQAEGQAPASPADPTAHRIFTSMSEITSLIARTGGRSNRGEMGDVRDFLATKGLNEAFGAVIGGGQFS